MLLGDFYRNPNRLSHYGKIILFNCKQASAANEDRGELLFCCLSFERDVNRFMKAADGAAVIRGKTPAHVDIVGCKCVINVRERVTTPCILVTKTSKKGDSYHYSLLTSGSSNRLEPCIEFKLPYQMKENVAILHGPTVLWSHDDDVFYTSPQAGEVRQIPIKFSHSIFGELPLHKERVFILGQQNISEKLLNNQPRSLILCYFVESGHMFDGTMVLPHPYMCITQCILVLSAAKEENVLKSDVVAATSNKQLVYFENGIVKETCQLPFDQPENIQVVNTGRCGFLFVVYFHQGHVCTVWRETFKATSHWSGVGSVHVDDFVGCGTDQMLLVFKDQGISGHPLENFLLTDLCGISFRSFVTVTTPPPENHLLTLQALESRLQSGLTVLQKLQREDSVKERVLQQSLRVLTGGVAEGEPEGLVALWDCDDEPKDEGLDDKKRDTPAVSSKPQVDKLWHRIAEDRLVVGVILTTDSSVPLASMSLSVLTETDQSSAPAVIKTQSQVFWLPSPSSSSSSSSVSTFPEPAAKKSRQHSSNRSNDLNTCRLAVTAVTTLTPLLNSGCVKCRVMLHYVQRRDAFALVSNQTPSVLQLQMLQFLDSLLAYLPDSCSVQPVKGTRGQEAAQIFSLALEKEVMSLRESVSSLLCEEEEKKSFGKEDSPDPGSLGGLQKVREMWQEDMERSRMRLSPLVDMERYHRLTQNMFKVLLDVDLATLRDTQRTLFS
uniref:FA complementation group B n=1 Tax=Labrus bergylta TaxID=56723 RepID=A0A3Q3N0U8_9LABR